MLCGDRRSADDGGVRHEERRTWRGRRQQDALRHALFRHALVAAQHRAPEPDLGALPTPSHPVAGVDGSPGAGRTFNVAQVKSALLRPGEIHPSGTTEAEVYQGDINQWSGLAAGWQDCGTQASGLLKELGGCTARAPSTLRGGR